MQSVIARFEADGYLWPNIKLSHNVSSYYRHNT